MPGLSRKAKHGKVRPVMNVTPLVDVVLVLLIIFMVVLPAVNSELNIELPPIANSDKDEDKADPIILSLDANGNYYIDENRISDDDLVPHLRARNAAEPNRRLVVRGDRTLHYEQVRELMAKVQDVGFPGVSLRVSKAAVDDASAFAKGVHRGGKS
ncbi:MAG: biopolymer transporter ExbD [Polyangiales bacterium]